MGRQKLLKSENGLLIDCAHDNEKQNFFLIRSWLSTILWKWCLRRNCRKFLLCEKMPPIANVGHRPKFLPFILKSVLLVTFFLVLSASQKMDLYFIIKTTTIFLEAVDFYSQSDLIIMLIVWSLPRTWCNPWIICYS